MMFSDFQQVEVVRIVDGDTFIGKFSTGLPSIYREMSVRIKGIDSPERSGKRVCEKRDAETARQELSYLLDGQKVDLWFCEKDKYFRLLCAINVKGQDAGEYMRMSGWASDYSGGTKIKWRCK